MRLVLFTQGYFGANLLDKLGKYGIEPVVYTYSADATRRKNDRRYLRQGYPYRYIRESSYDPDLIALSGGDLVVCAEWTKDFFHTAMPETPVYHIHPSLLPVYRGYGAVSEQFLRGVAISGVTLYKDNCHIDSGDILFARQIRLGNDVWPEDFMGAAADISAGWLSDMLAGKYPAGRPQSDRDAFYVQRRRSKQGLIDFNTGAPGVYNLIKAYSRPYFGSYFYNGEAQIKVWRAACEKWSGIYGEPGEVISRGPAGTEIACGEGSVLLTEIEKNGVVYKYDNISEQI